MLDPEEYDYYLLNSKPRVLPYIDPRVLPYKIKSQKIRNIKTKKVTIYQNLIHQTI